MDTKRSRRSRICVTRHVGFVDESYRGHRIARDVEEHAGTTNEGEKNEESGRLEEGAKPSARCAESARNKLMGKGVRLSTRGWQGS